MKTTTAEFAGFQRDSFGWRSIAWVLAIAFALQSYVIQTHIHGLALSVETSVAGNSHSKSSGPAKTPSDDSNSSCPYCQAIIHAGLFLMPAAQALYLPSLWAVCDTQPTCSSSLAISPAHGWQSRAPPRR